MLQAMARESKPMLFLPTGTTPATAAILIVQTLECKKLACKCELSKDILQYALKILLCDDDSSLYPSVNQRINSVFQTQHCTSVAMQTDNRNQHHASVQTEKCRIKLQKSGYKYTFNSSGDSSDVATQVTFNDFSELMSMEDSEEVELCIDSPIEIWKNKQTNGGNDSQIVQHTTKPRNKCKSDKHISLSLDFHGKRLIDETKNRPPFTIPLVRSSDAEVYDPRTFPSNISNKSKGSSHFPWKAQAICNCVAYKQKRCYDQKENNIKNITLMNAELHLNLPVTNNDNASSPLITPLNSISPNRLSVKDEICCKDTSKAYHQRTFENKDSNLAKIQKAVIPEEIAKDHLSKKDGKHKETHLLDCFCNLAPREACASDPRIKLICADVSADIRTSLKRNSGCSSNKLHSSKKPKLASNVEHNSSTTEQFGCLTPNESLSSSPETPLSLTLLSPESCDQGCQSNAIRKPHQQISLNKIESQTLIPSPEIVLPTKEVSSANNQSNLLTIIENNTNKPSASILSQMAANSECNKLQDLAIYQFTNDDSLLRESHVSTSPLLLSPKSEKKINSSVVIESSPKLPVVANTHHYVREETSITNDQNSDSCGELDHIKSANAIKNFGNTLSTMQKNANLEYKDNIPNANYPNNTMPNNGCPQTVKKDNYEHVINYINRNAHDSSISELVRVTSDQQIKYDIVAESNKLVKSKEAALQKTLNSDLSGQLQKSLSDHPKNCIDIATNLLDIPNCHIDDSSNKQICDEFSEKKKQCEEIYSPTDELSIDSDCDNMPVCCTAPSSPDKSPLLELDKNETKEKKNATNPYQKVIAAVPSYMPTRHSSLSSIDKLSVSNSVKCDRISNGVTKASQNNSILKTDKIEYSIPECTTSEVNSTMPVPLYSTRRLTENEMTQTEPEVKKWSSCSPWLQSHSSQNYYKWCGQANEFAPSHYQTFYPSYTNGYPAVTPNWMCYQWWNGNGNGWSQLW